MDLLGSAFPRLFSYEDGGSFVNRLRQRRFTLFADLVAGDPSLGKKVTILDVGGTYPFWSLMTLPTTKSYDITLLNLDHAEVSQDQRDNIRFFSVKGRAEELGYGDSTFNIVFSNSVIEHVGSWENQQRMAAEVKRVARRYFIQTPSMWFPLEPHAHLPLFQFLPRSLRALLIYNFKINHFPAGSTYQDCLGVSDSTLMLTMRKYRRLFPEAEIRRERLLGLTKSYTAVGGWGRE